MLLEIEKYSGTPRKLSLRGELDVSTADELRDTLLPDLEAVSGDFLLDLAQLKFMDSSGLHVIIEAANKIRGDLVLVNPSTMVRRVLEVSGIDHMPHLLVRSGNQEW